MTPVGARITKVTKQSLERLRLIAEYSSDYAIAHELPAVLSALTAARAVAEAWEEARNWLANVTTTDRRSAGRLHNAIDSMDAALDAFRERVEE